jgi:hypothetical protein
MKRTSSHELCATRPQLNLMGFARSCLRALTRQRYRLVVVALVAAGIALRARGFFFDARPLWRDEAGWAFILERTHLLEPNIRPLGFMAVSKFLVWCFGARESVLRLLPWVAGIGSTILAVPLAERLFESRAARVFLVGVLALHPSAIDFAKEFKPYSVSLFLHLSCLLLALRYLRSRRVGALLLALGVPAAGVLFAQDLVFAMPGLYLVVIAAHVRDRRWPHLHATVAFALLTIAGLLVLYAYFWRKLDVGPGGDTSFWGNKYDVFYVRHESGEGRWHWTLRKYLDIASFPGERRERWHLVSFLRTSATRTLAILFGVLWVCLHATGVARLVHGRRWAALTLLLTPLVTLMIFNRLGFWPLGTFRTNLFVLAYSAGLASFAVPAWPWLARREFAPLWCAVLLPLFAFERDWHAHKMWGGHESGFSGLAQTLVALQGPHHRKPPEPLVLDEQSCVVFDYYLKLQPDYRRFARDFTRRFAKTCNEDAVGWAQVLSNDRRVWLAVAQSRQIAEARAQLDGIPKVVEYRNVETGGVVVELAPASL